MKLAVSSLSFLIVAGAPGSASSQATGAIAFEPALGIGFDIDTQFGPAARLRLGLQWGARFRFGPELVALAAHFGETRPFGVSLGLRASYGESVRGSAFAHGGFAQTDYHGVQAYWDGGAAGDFALSDRLRLGAHARVCGLFWAESKSALWVEFGPQLVFEW